MIANAASDWWETIVIVTAALLAVTVGYVMGATRPWKDGVRPEERNGSGLERIRCSACGAIRFSREVHQCPKAHPQRQVEPLRVDVHFNSPVQRPTTRADYDRPVPPPPTPLPPPRVRDPIEAKAR